MTTDAKGILTTPTRRERQRAATYDEIVTVARQLLGKPEALSLRAIAAEMGLTAPALYRYVDSYQELLMLVARSIFEDVVSAMTRARDRYADDDPAAQTIAASVAFRAWALAHPEEFALIFASATIARPAEGPDAAGTSAGATSTTTSRDATIETSGTTRPMDLTAEGGEGFGKFFADIFRRLWDRYTFDLPADEDLDPALLQLLRDQHATGSLPCDFPGLPLGLSWVFVRCWARLYGTVTLEVFKHMDHGVITSGALFRSTLADSGRDLGFGDDMPRLQALTNQEMARQEQTNLQGDIPPEPSLPRTGSG
jgi:AcrR family transcriptional regulator